MILKKLLMRNDQDRDFKSLGGNFSEHMRQAADDYLLKKKKENLNVSGSLSGFIKPKEGDDKDGRTTATDIPSASS